MWAVSEAAEEADRTALRDAADQLYALPAAEFVAARTQLVRGIRGRGDRALADAVARLVRPSAAAALVNALVRGSQSVDALIALGAELRTAQDDGDAGRLRELAGERRRLVAELVQHATQLDPDRRPGQSVLDEVERTLTAAVLDHPAAEALRSGRLVRALAADGVEPADLAGAVAAEAASGGHPSSPPRPDAADRSDPEAVARAAELRQAQQRSAEADDAAEVAGRALADADDAVVAAQRTTDDRVAEADDLRRRLAELRRRLGAAESAADEAEDALDAARVAARAARRSADRAEEDVGQARRAVDRLR